MGVLTVLLERIDHLVDRDALGGGTYVTWILPGGQHVPPRTEGPYIRCGDDESLAVAFYSRFDLLFVDCNTHTGASDPYVKFELEQDNLVLDKGFGKKQSSVKKDDNSPVYNETFTWNIPTLKNM